MRERTRRDWLAATAGTAVGLGLAGCLSIGDSDAEGSTQGADDPTQTQSPEETNSPESAEPTQTGEPTQSAEPTQTEIHSGYETTEVEVRTPDGELLGEVTAAIADTPDLRFTGLSDTPSMPDDRGMLFVFDDVGSRTFVMRRMSFGLDIVYADDEGVITTIHHASEPGPNENGNEQEYPGVGQFVLEVNIDWTTERGVSEGDVLNFSL